jgi:hypothetical protein
MLLPSAFQDKDIPCTLGKKVERQEPTKADPIREFERHNHDIPCTAKLPDEYVKEAAKELKRQWEENLHAKRGQLLTTSERYKAAWDAFMNRGQSLAERANKRIEEMRASITPMHGEYRNGMVWDLRRYEWVPLAEWDASCRRLEGHALQWPTLDASALSAAQPLYLWGEGSVEGSWPVLGAEGK